VAPALRQHGRDVAPRHAGTHLPGEEPRGARRAARRAARGSKPHASCSRGAAPAGGRPAPRGLHAGPRRVIRLVQKGNDVPETASAAFNVGRSRRSHARTNASSRSAARLRRLRAEGVCVERATQRAVVVPDPDVAADQVRRGAERQRRGLEPRRRARRPAAAARRAASSRHPLGAADARCARGDAARRVRPRPGGASSGSLPPH
jgi:hypothetical protein